MRKELWRKGLVVGILVLFIGMSIVTSTGSILKQQDIIFVDDLINTIDENKLNNMSGGTRYIGWSVKMNFTEPNTGTQFGSFTFGEATETFYPFQDAYVNKDDPDANTGSSTYLWVTRAPNTRTYIQFDFSSIPSGSVITSATLQLYQSDYEGSGDRTYDLYLVNNSWDEETITWNTQLGTTFGDVFTTSAIVDTSQGWKSWNVTFDINACVNNISLPDHPYHGWMIRDHDEGTSNYQGRQFVSKDFPPQGQEFWPKLEVTYELSPEIFNVTITTSNPLDTVIGWENFTCTVTDNVEVDEVKLVLTGDITTEYPMIKDGDDYYCNITIPTADEYTYYIWANDTSRNYNTSISQPFSLPTNWDVNMDRKCHFMDLVAISQKYNFEGPPGWIRADVDNNGEIHFLDLVAVSMHYNEEW